MKNNARLKILAMFLLLSSCMENAQTGKQYRSIVDKSEVFKVRVSGIFPEDDTYSLFYTTNGSINFAAIKPVYKEVKAVNALQEVVFSLPERVKPTQLRIDFGKNKHQKTITLHEVSMSYKGKSIVLPETLIFSYFTPDYSKTASDATKATIRGIVKNGRAQSPSLYPKGNVLSYEIRKIIE